MERKFTYETPELADFSWSELRASIGGDKSCAAVYSYGPI